MFFFEKGSVVRMKKHLCTSGAALAVLALALLPSTVQAQTPAVSGAGCNNPSYNPAPGVQTIQLCNDPLADGLFTEDGVTGYQYIYDIFTTSGCCGSVHIGGTRGPLGDSGGFAANESAWWRATPGDPTISGVWQKWGNMSTTRPGVATEANHFDGFFGAYTAIGAVGATIWNYSDDAAVGLTSIGSTVIDTWDDSVTHQPFDNWFGTPGAPIPWARVNDWHLPSEYGQSSEWFMPGSNFGSGHVNDDGSTGVALQSFTTTFSGGALALQHTIRIVAPYEPGSIHAYLDAPVGPFIIDGPNGAAVPQSMCALGDADCDGYVSNLEDIQAAFTNFTGPGTTNWTTPKARIQGDVHGDGTGATTTLDPHDEDVDNLDIQTMFTNFNPAPDASGDVEGASGDLDPAIPDLIYDAGTGEVVIDWEGNTLISYVLKNGTNSFIPGNHNTILLGSFPTATSNELSESTSFAEPGVTTRSMGFVFPTGLDLTGLQSLLTVNSIILSLGGPQIPFDLVVVGGGPPVPEPAAIGMAAMGLIGLGLLAYRRRKAA